MRVNNHIFICFQPCRINTYCTYKTRTRHNTHDMVRKGSSSLPTSPSPSPSSSSSPAKVDLIREPQNPRHDLGPGRAHTYDGDEGTCNGLKTLLEVELGELGKLISEGITDKVHLGGEGRGRSEEGRCWRGQLLLLPSSIINDNRNHSLFSSQPFSPRSLLSSRILSFSLCINVPQRV